MKTMLRLACCGTCALLLLSSSPGGAPKTGPETEKRFPPLKVPAGFKANLFACDPFIEYPSAIGVGPRKGTLFVAIDYMTGLGTEIVRRDEVRLIEDTDGDGYADKSTVLADGFNSIMGLAYHDGTVYVMHAPFLTMLRDSDGDGKADVRKDLLSGVGLPPEKNPVRLHCANGVVVGHDGWLYLALGDNGCDIPRPEGDRLVLNGGGILRCRPDGRDLHVFASGLRNIYDVSLDAELNVFTRDNENDGGTYMIRLCHSFHGADHGYPYLYYERPDEAMAPIGDFGLGSSAGGVCYLEPAFPAEFRGNQFWCEWGRAVMRTAPVRSGSSFAPLKKEIEFAAAAQGDPYGFKPTDLVAGQDGALYVSDWCDGQRPKRGRGRIYRITPVGQAALPVLPKDKSNPSVSDLLKQLDSPSYTERVAAQDTLMKRDGQEALAHVRAALEQKSLKALGRMHAVWILARRGQHEALPDLFALAEKDADPSVRAQAVRAIADLTDPAFVEHKLAGRPGSAAIAQKLAVLAAGQDSRVHLEIVVALGRLRWADAPAWLQKNQSLLRDAPLQHAAMQTLRRSGNWAAVLKLLDGADQGETRILTNSAPGLALRALAGRYEPEVVDGLLKRLAGEANSLRRRDHADLLTRVYKKPAPWVYWGYRPPPRPAGTVAWERTEQIASGLDRVLADPDLEVRKYILARMQREKIPVQLTVLKSWLEDDHEPQRVAVLLAGLREHPDDQTESIRLAVVRDRKHAVSQRLDALKAVASPPGRRSVLPALELAQSLEDGPVLAAAMEILKERPYLDTYAYLLKKIDSKEAVVRAAALDALGSAREALKPAEALLQDPDKRVRRVAVRRVGAFGLKHTIPVLLRMAEDPEPQMRRECLDALYSMGTPDVIPMALKNLDHPETRRSALLCLFRGGPKYGRTIADVALRHPAAEIMAPAIGFLFNSSRLESNQFNEEMENLVAEVQGATGTLAAWDVIGPLAADKSTALREKIAAVPNTPMRARDWSIWIATGAEHRLELSKQKGTFPAPVWLAHSYFAAAETTEAQFLSGTNVPLRLWIDGKLVHEVTTYRTFQPDADRFPVSLARGKHSVLVEVDAGKEAPSVHVRFRKKSSSAIHEQVTQLALAKAGNADRGRKVFLNLEKSQCLKCHRLDNQGEKIGPDLTNIGQRFARAFLIESLLEPSRSISPGFQPQVVELKDGRVLTGLPIAETAMTLTLADRDGKKLEVAVANIETRRPAPQSIMPDGLERQLSQDEFVDLIAFLVSQK